MSSFEKPPSVFCVPVPMVTACLELSAQAHAAPALHVEAEDGVYFLSFSGSVNAVLVDVILKDAFVTVAAVLPAERGGYTIGAKSVWSGNRCVTKVMMRAGDWESETSLLFKACVISEVKGA